MENNLKLVCPKCGTPHQPHSPHTMDADGFERCEIRTVMEDRGWCYECSFWQNMYDKHKDDPGWVRIDGESWVLKPMVENVPSGWNSLGCGGRNLLIVRQLPFREKPPCLNTKELKQSAPLNLGGRLANFLKKRLYAESNL